MDSSADVVMAENERFRNFKLGKKPGHAHARSHSRNGSISSLKSLTSGNDSSHFSLPLTNHNGATKSPRPLSLPPLVVPGNTNNQNLGVLPTASTVVTNSISSSKRNSHHRRRSSVSTRHESAELMGIPIPTLPPAASEDGINFGEKDSIRRRALWALEGKPDVAFNKVEIPDFSSTDMEKMMSLKPSLTPSNPPSFGNSLNMNNKRDSFKLLAGSSSSKDQLQTLVEEEEEEEEEEEDLQCLQAKAEGSLPSPTPSIKENVPPSTAVTRQPLPKPRPATLNLKPLALTPENLMISPSSNSSSPSSRPGLRTLSLIPSSGGSDDSTSIDSQSRRGSQIVTPSPVSRRPVLNLALSQLTNSFTDGEEGKISERRSSISYKRSSYGFIFNPAGLPTPEMTPTFGQRFSNSGSNLSISSSVGLSEEDVILTPPQPQGRPLSTNEQHFLFKSHHALLARITDLEKALSVRMRDSCESISRRPSISSTVSGMSDSEYRSVADSMEGPSDEMLRLIADLKAERDELKRDVDGWRQRVNNLENQIAVLAKRVESERRDAWVARSEAGLLEVEKGVFARKLETLDELIKFHEKEKQIWEKEKMTLEREVQEYKQRVGELENQLQVVKEELDCEKAKTLHDPLATPTPNQSFGNAFVQPVVVISPPPELTGKQKHGLGFMSDYSESPTDVEPDSFDDTHHGFDPKAIDDEFDDDENGLAGYEDEDDVDYLSQDSSSSFDSEELKHPILRQRVGLSPSSTPPTTGTYKALPPAPTSLPSHFYQSSLSMNWTFPKGPPALVTKETGEEGVDRFFDCLDDNDSEGSDTVPSNFSPEKSKCLFARGFSLVPEDDNAAFFLPSGVGVPVPKDLVRQRTQLDVVTEEEEEEQEKEQSDFEDDGEVFGEIGGITITFTPPEEEEEKNTEQIQVSSPKPKHTSPPVLPALNFGRDDDDDDGDPFNFGRPLERKLSLVEKSPLISSSVLPLTPVVKPDPPPLVTVSSPPPASVGRSASTSSSLPRSTCGPMSPSMIPRVMSPTISSRVSLPGPTARRPSSTMTSKSAIPSGRSTPSLIPQPPSRTAPAPPKARTAPTSTFIRQPPVKKSLVKAENVTARSSPNGSTMPAVVLPLDEGINVASLNRSSSESRAFTSFFNSFVNNSQSSVDSTMTVDLVPNNTRSENYTFVPNSQSLTPSIPAVLPPSPSTTRLSFQTLTNLVPWSSRNRSPTIALSSSRPSPKSTVVPLCRGFVSREKQLRRLQMRIQKEGIVEMKSRIHVQCNKCNGEVAVI